ncbi:MAG: hypothetical protein HYV40_04445 [Candidatus Levybacteria bacterium]|nr:hypothetical protein [Candidatus Levybacteria bacterium]
MENLLCLYKPVGQTSLQTIRAFQDRFPEYKEQTLSVAGRLDPMAEGLLLVLIGEENKQRKYYEALEKAYEFDVLFGITTDSYDLLGFPKLIRSSPLTKQERVFMYRYMKTKTGKQIQTYPPFSSKPVHGKPLYYWARKGEIDQKNLPTKEVFIRQLSLQRAATISMKSLFSQITSQIEKLYGDFRQDDILSSWKTLAKEHQSAEFSVVTFEISCSSGTYVRAITNEMGDFLKTGAVTDSITRTRIGNFSIDDALRV